MFLEHKAGGERHFEGPSLSGLAYALRHPELWPEDFEWDYWPCATCAMGLAHRLWPQQIPNYNIWAVAGGLGIDQRSSAMASLCDILLSGNRSPIFMWKRTKPHQIARALESLNLRLLLTTSTRIVAPCDTLV